MYETIQPVEQTPFGENVDLYIGELIFLQTNIEIPGVGLAIMLARELIAFPKVFYSNSSSSIQLGDGDPHTWNSVYSGFD